MLKIARCFRNQWSQFDSFTYHFLENNHEFDKCWGEHSTKQANDKQQQIQSKLTKRVLVPEHSVTHHLDNMDIEQSEVGLTFVKKTNSV